MGQEDTGRCCAGPRALGGRTRAGSRWHARPRPREEGSGVRRIISSAASHNTRRKPRVRKNPLSGWSNRNTAPPPIVTAASMVTRPKASLRRRTKRKMVRKSTSQQRAGHDAARQRPVQAEREQDRTARREQSLRPADHAPHGDQQRPKDKGREDIRIGEEANRHRHAGAGRRREDVLVVHGRKGGCKPAGQALEVGRERADRSHTDCHPGCPAGLKIPAAQERCQDKDRQQQLAHIPRAVAPVARQKPLQSCPDDQPGPQPCHGVHAADARARECRSWRDRRARAGRPARPAQCATDLGRIPTGNWRTQKGQGPPGPCPSPCSPTSSAQPASAPQVDVLTRGIVPANYITRIRFRLCASRHSCGD